MSAFAPRDQKALYRVGQRVTHDDCGTIVYAVVSKEWDGNGTLFYTIRDVETKETRSGVKQKYLRRAN